MGKNRNKFGKSPCDDADCQHWNWQGNKMCVKPDCEPCPLSSSTSDKEGAACVR